MAPPQVAAKPEPKGSSYPQTEDGLAQFVREHDAWLEANPDAAAKPEGEAAQPAAEAAQPGEEKPAAEEAAAKLAAEPEKAAGPLPQEFEAAINGDAALKAALEANPAAQKLIMDSARQLEAGKPVLQMVPTVAAAEFMTTHANTMLDLRHNALLGVENPDARTAFLSGLRNQFVETDDKGAPVLDAAGKPVMGKDYDLCLLTPAATEKLGGIQERMAATVAALEQKLKGYYPSEADKAADQKRLDDTKDAQEALVWTMDLLKLEGGEGEMALPPLPDDATPAQREAQARLERMQAELKKDRAAAGKGSQTEAVKTFEREQRISWQSGVGKFIDDYLKAAKERGEVISDYHIQQKWINPATKQQEDVGAFAVTVLFEFDKTVMGITKERDAIYRLERMGPAGKQLREANAARLRTTYLEPIIRKHIQAIQDGIRQSQTAEEKRRAEIATVARVEPQTAATAGPQPNLTDAQIQEKAQAMVTADPRWKTADADERQIMLMNARVAVKYGT